MAVVGIDLGTTNTVVGVVQSGQARAIRDDAGEHLMPSVVSFHENGSVLVGRAAKERRVVDAANTIYSIKRLIGRSWNSEEVGRARSRFPFDMREGPGQAALVVARNETFTLPEISAFVLRHAKSVAERVLGEPVDRAVITVPANFNDLQRAATKVAGRVAGLEVLRILNEPTAAALAYGYGKGKGERVVIYDFGGGTFDVTLLDLSGNVFEVLATAGNTFLGGDDVDLAIAERMAEACDATLGIDAHADPQVFERLRYYAEKLKVQLSTLDQATIQVPDVGKGAGNQRVHLDFALSRADLESLAAPFVARSFDVCRDALGIARLEPKDFDQVVLVGGTTRLPMVQRLVTDFFGRRPLDRINPDEVVAIGAAIQATALTYAERRRSIIPKPPMPAARSLEGSIPGQTARRRSQTARPTDRPSGLPSVQRSQLDVDPNALRAEARARHRQGIVVPSPRTSRPPPLPPKKTGDTRPAPFGSDRPKRKGGTLGGVGSAEANDRPSAPDGFHADLPSLTRTGDSKRPSHHPLLDSLADDGPTEVKAAPEIPASFFGTPGQAVGSRAARQASDDEPTVAGVHASAIEEALARELPLHGIDVTDDSDFVEMDLPELELDFDEEDAQHRPFVTTEPRGNTTNRTNPGMGTTTPGFAIPDLPPPRRTNTGAPPLPARTTGAGARTTGAGAEPPPRATASRSTGGPPTVTLSIDDPLPPLDLPPLVDVARRPPRTADREFGAIGVPGGADFAALPPVSSRGAPSDDPFAPQALGDPFGSQAMNSPFSAAVPAAHSLSPGSRIGSRPPLPLLVDVTPLSLCVETVGGFRDVVVDRNTPIPCEQSHTFVTAQDHQDSVRVRIGQGEADKFAENTVLGELQLTGLRVARRGEVRVVVTFALDTSGMLDVRAVDDETGKVAAAQIRLVGLPDNAEVGLMTERARSRQTQ